MEKISETIVNNFFNKKEDSDERDILIFGVQRFLEDITKIIIITIIAAFLGILKEVYVVFAVMMVYKNFVGGAHARTNLECVFFTTLCCFIPIYMSKFFLLSNSKLLILTVFTVIFSIVIIVKFAPADTENIPIVNKKQRLKLKIGAGIVLPVIIIFFGMVIRDSYLYEIVLICLNISNFNTTPLMYRLLRCKYSNGKID